MDFEERFKLAVKEAKLARREWEALDHSICEFEGNTIHYCKHPLPINNIPSRKMGKRISEEMIQKLKKLKEVINK